MKPTKPKFEATVPARPATNATGGRLWLAQAVVAAAIALAYGNSFQGVFLFDDMRSIPQNESIRQLWPLGPVLSAPFEGGRTVDGRPLVNLSLALNYAISGLEVGSYHALNLLVHIAAALTLFGVVRRTLLLPKFHNRFDESATSLALAVALIWGVHPLQTESVTYIIQRAESLVGLFYLLVLYGVVRGETSSRPAPWFASAVACCVLGMATKEVMVTAPVVTALYLRVFVHDSWRGVFAKRWKLLAGLAATWLLLAALILRLQGRGGSVGWGQGLSTWQYLVLQSEAIVTYLKLSVTPQPLVLDYGVLPPATVSQQWPYLAAVLLLLGLSSWKLSQWSAIGFLGMTFFLILSPSSSVVPIVTQTVAEHRMYLPLAPVVTLLVMGAYTAWQRTVRRMDPEARERPMMRAAPAVVACAVALLFGVQTWLRNLDYHSAVRIWQDTTEKRPHNLRAWSNLCESLLLAGHPEEMLAAATRAIELNPDSAEAWYSRGTYKVQIGQYAEALADFDQSLKLEDQQGKTWQNRGVAKRRLGRHAEAIEDFNRAIELEPRLSLAYRSRAFSLAALGQHEAARQDAKRYLELEGTVDAELQAILERTTE